MKKTLGFFGVIAAVVIAGFSMTGCLSIIAEIVFRVSNSTAASDGTGEKEVGNNEE